MGKQRQSGSQKDRSELQRKEPDKREEVTKKTQHETKDGKTKGTRRRKSSIMLSDAARTAERGLEDEEEDVCTF